MTKPAKQTVLLALRLLRERYERDVRELVNLAAAEEGFPADGGWSLNTDTSEWQGPGQE